MMDLIFKAGITLFLLVMVLYVIIAGINNYAFDRIWEYMEHWEGVAERAGMKLTLLPGGYDDAPCEAVFLLEGRLARIERHSWSMLRILRQLKSGRVREEELMSRSRWPSSKMPK